MIVDVGFGDGFIAPLPLQPGTYTQSFLRYRVSRDGPRWRVDNHAYGGVDGFDFTLTARTLDDFAAVPELQTSPESGFVKTTVCERFTREGLAMLRGATLREVTAAGVMERVLQDADDFAATLETVSARPSCRGGSVAASVEQASRAAGGAGGAGRGTQYVTTAETRARIHPV